MGTYYHVVCIDLKEKIEPGDINDLGIKGWSYRAFRTPLWSDSNFRDANKMERKSVHLMGDYRDDIDIYNDYINVTKQLIDEYNKYYKTDLVFTGGN